MEIELRSSVLTQTLIAAHTGPQCSHTWHFADQALSISSAPIIYFKKDTIEINYPREFSHSMYPPPWRPQPQSPLASPSPLPVTTLLISPLIFLTTACVYVVPFKSQFHKQIDVNYFLAASSVRHDVYEPHPCSVQS